jgi:hypothetical protein
MNKILSTIAKKSTFIGIIPVKGEKTEWVLLLAGHYKFKDVGLHGKL